MNFAKASAAWTLMRAPLEVERAYHIQVAVTERCNFACAGCVKSDPAHRPSNRDMRVEDFERLLSRLRPRIVTLLGEGDPLLHRRFADLLRSVKASGARSLVATNLSVGDSAFLEELLDAGVDSMRVTLSHSDPERYREIKGRNVLEEVLARLDCLRSLRVTRSTTLVLEFWIDTDSLHEIAKHLELASAQAVQSAEFLMHRPLEQHGPLSLSGEQLRILLAAAELARRLDLRTNLDALVRKARTSAAASPEARARCALPWLRAYVDVNGRAGPCVDIVTKSRSGPANLLDNAFDESLDRSRRSAYSGPGFRAIRECFRAGKAPHEVCRGCTKGRVTSLRSAARIRG